MAAYDAILIPGGGVRAGGRLPLWVIRRLDRALDRADGAYLVPLSGGTPHRAPPLDDRGLPILEARAAAQYLVARGADPRHILIEASSRDTVGNAYFSRVIHAIPQGFARALVITSEFHMPRTEAAFRWIYSLDAPGVPCELDFESVPDDGVDPAMLRARIDKERAGLSALALLRKQIRTFPDLHLWLFTQHGAYAAAPRPQPDGGVDTRMY